MTVNSWATDDPAPRHRPTDSLRHRLLDLAELEALAEDDLAGASRLVGLELPEELKESRSLWELRRDQLTDDPSSEGWLVGLLVVEDDTETRTGTQDGTQPAQDADAGPAAPDGRAPAPLRGRVVGAAGFHGPPDDRGMVEVGYRVLRTERGRGYGHGAMATLMDIARSRPESTVLRASVAPDNAASLAIVAAAGLERVGEQIDEIDGLEWIFETDL